MGYAIREDLFKIPNVRSGGYQPFFLVNRERSEAALMSVIQESWINGVSTRKMRGVFKSFGIEDILAGQVSQVTKELDGQVQEFRSSPLSGTYPVIWSDALYEKIRDARQVVSKAIMVALGMHTEGQKEKLAIESMENESTDTWIAFFDALKQHRLEQVGLVVFDAHKGIQAALKASFLGSTWQGCKVHFMRHILAKIAHKHNQTIGKEQVYIFNQDAYDRSKAKDLDLIQPYIDRFPDAMDCLSDGLEDALQFLLFDELPKGRISSTNHLEPLNLEIRRRSNVVGVFPSTQSYLRLIASYLIEYQAEWTCSKAYINTDSLLLFRSRFSKQVVPMAA